MAAPFVRHPDSRAGFCASDPKRTARGRGAPRQAHPLDRRNMSQSRRRSRPPRLHPAELPACARTRPRISPDPSWPKHCKRARRRRLSFKTTRGRAGSTLGDRRPRAPSLGAVSEVTQCYLASSGPALRSATLTRALPRFSPRSMPMNAAGAFSRPSVTSSRQMMLPSATQRANRVAASSKRCA
jgi:hypothetical protein